VVAVTGATVPLTVAGKQRERTAPLNAPFALLAGDRLTLGVPDSGLRSYLAFRGGIDVAEVLGSRSTDTLSGLGPPILHNGMRLAIEPAPPGSVVDDPDIGFAGYPGFAELRFVPGPRADWFDDAAVTRLTNEDWTIGNRSNRVGVQLEGRPLVRIRHDELPSEGTVSGAIQVPPDGLPILFLADHPVTGGYPVIGVVVAADLDQVAQLPPGSRVRFTALAPGRDR
jgi:Allophanate hydrolase subunit 2